MEDTGGQISIDRWMIDRWAEQQIDGQVDGQSNRQSDRETDG